MQPAYAIVVVCYRTYLSGLGGVQGLSYFSWVGWEGKLQSLSDVSLSFGLCVTFNPALSPSLVATRFFHWSLSATLYRLYFTFNPKLDKKISAWTREG